MQDRAELEILPCDASCEQRRAEKKVARTALREKIAAERRAAGLDEESEPIDQDSDSEQEIVNAKRSSSTSNQSITNRNKGEADQTHRSDVQETKKPPKETPAQRKKNAARRRMFSYIFMGAILLLLFVLMVYLARTSK